jgi:5-(carboxyamino)imidazole ribonucleotide synthase
LRFFNVGLKNMVKPFEKTIGIIGAGQLGKMLIESAAGWNVNYAVLENDAHAPAVKKAGIFIQGKLTDGDKIRELATHCDVMTFEIEHIDADTLYELEQQGKTVIPSASILKIIQNKGSQKQYFIAKNLPTSPFVVINHASEIDKIESLSPEIQKVVVKSCRDGYDGKGVSIMNKSDLMNNGLPFEGSCVVEAFVANAREISIIVARGKNGETKVYPATEMVFDPLSNLVDYLFAPAEISPNELKKANEIAIAAIEGFNGVGIFAVELFLNHAGAWFINEIAPRPHNSGHHTIEACYTSQYEQLNRILLGLPLGDTSLIKPAAMVNLVGSNDFSGNYSITGLDACLTTPGFYLHLYNKSTIKPDRKMGHFTVLASSAEEAVSKALNLKQHLKFKQE